MIGFAHNRADTAPAFFLASFNPGRPPQHVTPVLFHSATIFDVFPQTNPTSANEAQSGKSNENNV